LWPGLAALALVTVYLIALLGAEKQPLIIGLLAVAIVAGIAAGWFRWLTLVSRSCGLRGGKSRLLSEG
jgi:hypothetical protein